MILIMERRYNMEITLYTTDCPKCKILESKLEEKGAEYKICKDQDIMIEKGFMSAPVLEVDGKTMTFGVANKFVNEL